MNDGTQKEPLSPEEELVQQFDSVSDALVRVITSCEDARQFAGVIRLAIRNNENQMALSLIDAMIARLNIILEEYKDISDEELVDIVMEKLKANNGSDTDDLSKY